MSKLRSLLYCTATLGVIQLIAAGTSHAVPAFSRAHKVECTTCHTIYPELNEYGEAFLKNSYVYVGKGAKGAKKAAPAPAAAPAAPATAAPAGDAPVVKGEGDASKLSRLKAGAMGSAMSNQPAGAAAPVAAAPAPAVAEATDNQAEGMILAGIPELLPISFTGSINYAMGDNKNKSATGGTEVDFAARSFKLHAAGNFRDTVGFFATYVAYSEQPPAGTFNTSTNPSNNKSDLNEFYVQWRHMFNSPVNLKIGRMQPKLGLWKTNNKLSVTNNYMPYNYSVGQGNNASAFSVEQTQDAIELNATLAKRLFLAAGIVNRKGQDNKEGYGHLSYKFGGADYLGNEPDVDLNKEETILDFLTVTLGTYGYYGKNGLNTSGAARNIYGRAGLDAEVQYKIFRLRMLGGWGIDDNAVAGDTTKSAFWPTVISRSGTVEGELTLLTNLIAAGRFEFLQQRAGDTIPANVFASQHIRRYIATLGYAPLENFKLSSEFKYQIDNTGINRIGTVGATFSF